MFGKLICSLLLGLSFLSANAQQNAAELRSAVGQLISKNLQNDKIMDSTAVYATALLVDVDIVKGKQLLKYEFNNYEFQRFFSDLSVLEKLDYSSLLKKQKSGKFIYQIYITVTNSTYSPALIDIEIAEQAVIKLLAQATGERESLGSLMIKLDKKVYH
jgi:hypothetical protein